MSQGRERKRSSHRSMLVHFHDNGEVCPQSYGQSCPHGGLPEGQDLEPMTPSSFSKLPNGFKFPPLNGFKIPPSMYPGRSMSSSTAGKSDMNMVMANFLSAASTSGGDLNSMPVSSTPMTFDSFASDSMQLNDPSGFLIGAGGNGYSSFSTGFDNNNLSSFNMDFGGNTGFANNPSFRTNHNDPASALLTGLDFGSMGMGGGAGAYNLQTPSEAPFPNNGLSAINYTGNIGGNGLGGLDTFSDNSLSVMGGNTDPALAEMIAATGGPVSTGFHTSSRGISPSPSFTNEPVGGGGNPVAAMAQMAVTSGNPAAVAAMAKMAASSGNQAAAAALAQIAQSAASNGSAILPAALVHVMAKTGFGGRSGLAAAVAATKTTDNPNRASDQMRNYQARMAKQAANVQITKTLANSSLAKMSDEQVKEMSEGQFESTKDFINYMQSPNTEIRGKQEQLLKVRNFLPPQAQEPEIFLLEKLVASATEADAKLSNGGEASGHEGFLPSLAGGQPQPLPRIYDPDMPERLRLQEDLMKFKVQKRDGDSKREHLLNRARVLQTRALTHKAKLAGLWEEKLKDEQVKTGPLEEVCAALREALDAEHRRRMEAFETKMKPIIIRDGPSRKANHKIAAAKLYYDIYSMSQRLRLTTIRVEHEESKRERVEREVKRLRDEISVKKTTVTTVTKGIPVNKIEVRPQGQQPSYSGPTGVNNPIFAGLSAGAQASLSSGLPTSGPIMTEAPGSSIPGLPSLPGIGLPPELQQVSRSTPPPDRRGMPGLSSAGMMFPPRSAKISKEEAAAAAGGLASTKTDYNGTKGAGANARVPNGRPPQPIRIN